MYLIHPAIAVDTPFWRGCTQAADELDAIAMLLSVRGSLENNSTEKSNYIYSINFHFKADEHLYSSTIYFKIGDEVIIFFNL